MINFALDHFVTALKLLSQERRIALERELQNPNRWIVAEDLDRVRSIIGRVATTCQELLLNIACNRAERVDAILRRHAVGHKLLTYAELRNQLEVLWEAIDDDIRYERFFHYAKHKIERLLQLRVEWAATLTAFPSAQKEIEEGVDCYGLEHNTACVFHMMRVAEIGMRALARERGVTFPKHPLEWADWQNILEQTESKAESATSGMARGPAKDSAQLGRHPVEPAGAADRLL